MKIVESSIRYPVTTTVFVLLLALFGSLALFNIPVQLTPTVEDPIITVSTFWRGASPTEVEREIVDQQEEQLKSLEGLVEMESDSADSQGTVTLSFRAGVDLDAMLLRVSNRLDQVPSYPANADKPVIRTSDPNFGAIAWFVLRPHGDQPFEGDITTLYEFVDDNIKPAMERVPGVASSNFFGAREREVQVVVDPVRLAARGITMNQVATAIERENRSFSGGDFDEGKRRYIVRTVGDYTSVEDIENIVVATVDGVPVYVRDFATARLGNQKAQALAFEAGQPIIAINAVRQTGANVLAIMEQLSVTAERINRELLAPRGLILKQVYDETTYIKSAIALVKQSLALGGVLAVIVLLLFLRSGTSTLVIGVAIPISMVGTFLMMNALDRTLNVISLAGMAFAVGMVVDNSIVVLENIYRHRQMGKDRSRAAYDGAREVWGAILASTLTTIAVFVPVLFIEEEAGQLFRDIAIAISCAVGLSLLVSITVIPSLAARILRVSTQEAGGQPNTGGIRQLWGLVGLAGRFTDGLSNVVHWLTGSIFRRLAVVLLFTAVAVGGSLALLPKAEYLPTGSQNWLFGIVLPPPGYSLAQVSSMQNAYVEVLSPLWEPPPEETVELPGGGIDAYFYVSLPNLAFMGVRSRDPMRTGELIPEFFKVNPRLPGTIAFVQRASIFQRGIGAGRAIDIEISGPDLTHIIAIGDQVFGQVTQVLPGSQARPIPSLDLGNPEIRVRPDRRRAAELGITNRDLAVVVSALVDGTKVSDYRFEGNEIDIRLMTDGTGSHRTHLLEQLPIATPSGRLVTLGSFADIELTSGPASIRHVERERSIAIQVTPAETTPLQEAMETIESEILQPLRDSGQLGGLYRASLSGEADKLTQTGKALIANFLLAIIITYLLMAALFESFLYPFVIMFSVPLAALGGFLGLKAINLPLGHQPMDILTMLGFIILVGTVVNNAILIVHQSLNHMREDGMRSRDAIRESTRNRVRPILMSVMTSVFGMLPLVLFPGAGSELYRGLGSVVIGGLLLSTLFTLFLVPSLFSLVLDARDALFGAERADAHRPAEG